MEESKKEKRSYTHRDASEYNCFRTFFQIFICAWMYMIRYKLVYRLEVHGKENIPKDNDYIVCANHLSTLDPPLLCGVWSRRICFMAKKELFDIFGLRLWLDWLGAFAVNREKLGPSTIKTARMIKGNTNWVLGLFPQGTRGEPGTITGVTKGFATLAKATKCGIVPVGITGTNEVKRLPFSGKIIVNIGEVIPYSDNVDEMVSKWVDSVQNLTGFKYVENVEPVEN